MRSRANFSASSVWRVAGLHRGVDFGGGDAQAAGVEIEPVELARRLDQRRIAARGHVVDDGAGRRLDIGRNLALGGRKAANRSAKSALLLSRRTGMVAFRRAGPLVDEAPLLNGAAANGASTLLGRHSVDGREAVDQDP